MNLLHVVILLMVGAGGTCVVFTRDPVKQTLVLTFYGMLLSLMFLILQAPDVALSQIVIGAVVLPLMILLTAAKIRRQSQKAPDERAPTK